MNTHLRLIIAQQNFLVGDLIGNTLKITQTIAHARDTLKGDVVIFPELALTGYSPEDLLLRPGMEARVTLALAQIAKASRGIDVILGHPHKTAHGLYNAASVLREGKILSTYHKRYLPNVQVFDEKRYFTPGEDMSIVTIKGVRCALMICEDIWQAQTMLQAKHAGAQLMLVINASPYHEQKVAMRREIITAQARSGEMPIVYVNLIGGQDELVFDGGSFAVDAAGEFMLQAPFYTESVQVLECTLDDAHHVHLIAQPLTPVPHIEESIYQALVLGLRDYVNKNHFNSVIIGLSGGIDSALTAAIAIDALGSDRVHGVLMPSRYTDNISIIDALEECKHLNITPQTISIEPVFSAFLDLLKEPFNNKSPDVTEENLQARARGVILMALSNKFGHLVLATSNKSEMAVGYSTLYGDMVGGFCVLKDVWKTMVYRLARYRNEISPVIPERVLSRAPTAELAAQQCDQDSLPPYEILDQILAYYIEQDEDEQDIIARGFDSDTVHKLIRLVNRNEYKRRQAPIGVCITLRAFGRNRRYPITAQYEISP